MCESWELVKCCFVVCSYLVHVHRMRSTVKTHLQCSHVGAGTSLLLRRQLCVKWVCPIRNIFSVCLHRLHAVADSRAGRWRRSTLISLRSFFSIRHLFPNKRHISLCTFAIHDDGADTLSSAPSPLQNFWIRHWLHDNSACLRCVGRWLEVQLHWRLRCRRWCSSTLNANCSLWLTLTGSVTTTT